MIRRIQKKMLISLMLSVCFMMDGVKAQSTNVKTIIAHTAPINFFNINFTTGELPQDILMERSVGIVFSDQRVQKKKEVWKEIVKLSHPTFAQVGIDVVAWYNAKEVELSDDRRSILAEILDKRQVKYIVFIFFEKNRLSLHITQYNGSNSLISEHQTSWTIHDNKIDVLLSMLRRTVVEKNLKKTNLLIADFPEFHTLVKKRYSVDKEDIALRYEPGLRSSLLNINLPPKIPIKELSPNVQAIDSVALYQLLKDYPYRYEVISPTISNDELRKKKSLLRLFWLYGTPESIFKTYHIDTSRWKGKSENIPVLIPNVSYFKPMVKNIYTGKISCGDRWDGATQPMVALEKFMKNIQQ